MKSGFSIYGQRHYVSVLSVCRCVRACIVDIQPCKPIANIRYCLVTTKLWRIKKATIVGRPADHVHTHAAWNFTLYSAGSIKACSQHVN